FRQSHRSIGRTADGRSVGRHHSLERKSKTLPVKRHSGEDFFLKTNAQPQILRSTIARIQQPGGTHAPRVAAYPEEILPREVGTFSKLGGTPEIQRMNR